VASLAQQLEADHGRGFSPKNLHPCCALRRYLRQRKLSTR
jgi:hypothetical protein